MIDNIRKNEDFRRTMKERQYLIPTRYYLDMQKYPHVPWVVATELYQLCVRQVLLMHNVELLLDIPFGKGFVIIKQMFFYSMNQAEIFYKGDKE